MKLTKATVRKIIVAKGLSYLAVEIPESFGFKEGEEVIVSIRKPVLQKAQEERT